MKKHSSLLLLALFAFTYAHAGDWTQFRGTEGQGHARAENLPWRWDAATNVKWKTPLAGQAWSSPVLGGGKVFLTNAVTAGEGVSLRALRLDAETGKVEWDAELFEIEKAPRIHRKNSHASPTPFLEAGRLYVHFGPHGTACLDLAGKVIWKKRYSYSPVHGSGCSPVIEGDLLLFSADGAREPALYALDKNTGEVRWKTPRDSAAKRKFSFCTPLVIEVDGRRQIISPASDYAFAYDLSGRQLWKFHYPGGYSVVPRPIYAHGLVYICSGYDRPILHAVRPTGKGDVTRTHLGWKVDKNAPHNASVVVVGDLFFMAADTGVVSCLNARSGELLWRERVSGSCSASLLHAEGRVYLIDESGETFVFAARDKYELLARNPLNERALASIAATDGALFIRTASALRRIEE